MQIRRAPWLAVTLSAVVLLALILRGSSLGAEGFWLDEIFGASFVNLNPAEVVIAVLRFDLHPPLYYLQLRLWAVVSQSDVWLMLNSVAWSMVTIAIVASHANAIGGRLAGIISAGLMAVLASDVMYASELRMYSMTSALVALGLMSAEQWAERPTRPNAVRMCLIVAALAATHSAAFLAISSIVGYAMLGLSREDRKPRVALPVLACVAALLFPWLVNASLRSTSHLAKPDLDAVMHTLSGWLLGYPPQPLSSTIIITAFMIVVTGVIFVLAAGRRHERNMMLAFVVWPCIAAFAVSNLLRPIWVPRILVFGAPIWVLALSLYAARAIKTHSHATRAALSATCIVIFAISLTGSVHLLNTPRKMQYREAAAHLARENTDKLPISAPSTFTFWGMARYLVGPDWGNVLAVQAPPDPNGGDVWSRVYAKLGDQWLDRLGLAPKTRHIGTPSGDLYIGGAANDQEDLAAGHWLVTGQGKSGDPSVCEPLEPHAHARFRGVDLVLCLPPTSDVAHVSR